MVMTMKTTDLRDLKADRQLCCSGTTPEDCVRAQRALYAALDEVERLNEIIERLGPLCESVPIENKELRVQMLTALLDWSAGQPDSGFTQNPNGTWRPNG